MIKRSFIGLAKPRLEYGLLEDIQPELVRVPTAKKVTLFLDSPFDPYIKRESDLLKIGEKVKTGQKLQLSKDSEAYVISTVTGTISSITSFTSDLGRKQTAVSIDVASEEVVDETFGNQSKQPSIKNLLGFLEGAPGNPNLNCFSSTEKAIGTIAILGADKDLLPVTNQYVVKSKTDAIKAGIRVLKEVTGVANIVIAVPQSLMQAAGATGAQARVVDSQYPAALPLMIMKDVLGQVVPAGKTYEDLGVCFLSAEAVASIGSAYESGQLPISKIFTLIKKDGGKILVSARIGTSVKEVFNACNIAVKDNDRIIFGGIMTGSSAYSEELPIQSDTDAIIIQDSEEIPQTTDYPCINCGDCIRICPANMPVNMLVRLLEAGQYEEAVDSYDLDSCVECGLCSYVCVSRIPIFQYIRMAKKELARIKTAEATNE